MSEKRGPVAPFFHQRGEPSTLRSIEVADEIALDTEQQLAPVYVEPQPLVSASDHKTIEIQTVKLAEDIDPRKLQTELRLVRPPSVPPSESSWPLSEAGLVSTQPPLAERRRSRARVVVVALFALLLLGSGLALRGRLGARATSDAPALTTPAAVVAEPTPTPTAVVETVPAPVAPVAPVASAEPDAAPVASAEPAASAEPGASASIGAASRKHRTPRTPKTNRSTVTPSSRELATPSSSNPKRAIY